MELVREGRAGPVAVAAAAAQLGRGERTERVAGPASAHGASGRDAVRADLDEVFRRDYRAVVGVAARVLGARDQAEDVAQEVFLSFSRSSVPAGEARGWLCVAAAHTALNLLRSGRRRAAREGTAAAVVDVVGPDVAETVVTIEERRRVRAALARLPRKQAVALVLRHSGLSYADVARRSTCHPRASAPRSGAPSPPCARSWTMRHPTEGVLRRLLDEPAGVADSDRGHVADCSTCLAGLAAAREDAVLVGAALSPAPGPDLGTAAAWHRLSTASAPVWAPARRPRRSSAVLRGPAAAALAVAVVLTGAGTAAASGWLPIFRTERIAPLRLSAQDLVALPDLGAYGELTVTRGPDVHDVPDAAAAAAATHLDVPDVPDLPRGVVGQPTYSVGGQLSATFTFSAERTARAVREAGQPLPPLPTGLQGSAVRLVAGPGVAQTWSSSAGAPALVVGRAVAPAASSSGLAFEVVRDYLLALPGLPADVAAQLRAYAGDGSTLPLPVPSERPTTSSAEVDGRPATVLTTRDRALSAVVWVDDGVVTVVAGSLDDDEVLAVARGLR